MKIAEMMSDVAQFRMFSPFRCQFSWYRHVAVIFVDSGAWARYLANRTGGGMKFHESKPEQDLARGIRGDPRGAARGRARAGDRWNRATRGDSVAL